MMNVEQEIFIRLLRDYVHQDISVEPEGDIAWEKIVRYAEEQDLCGIIYYQTRGFRNLTSDATRRLKEGFFSNVFLSVNADHECDQLIKAFRDEKIEYMPFKGMLLREYYPHSELRTMGDRDILIHPEDRQESDKIMLGLGYQLYEKNHSVWAYCKPNLMIEIHEDMFYENLANQIDYREYFSHIWESPGNGCGSENYSAVIPEPDMHFLYCIAHLAKHVINKGMGFRAFLDLAFFVKNAAVHTPPDWEWIQKELTALRLFDFTTICFSLCREWFGIEMPFLPEKEDPDFVKEITEKVFKDGIFGLDNKENAVSGSAKNIHRSDYGYLWTSLALTLHKLFPPYRNMQLIPWYRWVDGKPYLLPVAWVYRWFYCLINKRKASQDIMFEPYTKKETIVAREKYLDRWHL